MNKFEFDNTKLVKIQKKQDRDDDKEDGKTVIYVNETPKETQKSVVGWEKWGKGICWGTLGIALLGSCCWISYRVGKAHGTLVLDGKQYSIGPTGAIHNESCRDFDKVPLKQCKNCGGLKK